MRLFRATFKDPVAVRYLLFVRAGRSSDCAELQDSVEAAPTDQILSSYQGQTVTSINIAGRPDLKAEAISRSHSHNKPVSPSTRQKIDKRL